MDPADGEYDPGGQPSQESDPVEGKYAPAGQTIKMFRREIISTSR